MAYHFSSSAAAAAAVNSEFSMLRLDSLKRRSPPSAHQPNPKKEKLSPTPTPPSPPPRPLFPGFSKITPLPPLPKSGRPARTRPNRNPLLRRCISALAASPPSVVSKPQPQQPKLHRSASALDASPAAKSRSSSSSDDADVSPTTKRRLKRIKDRFREMTMWFERVMLEDADDDGDVTQVEEDEKAAAAAADQDEEEVQVINVEATDDENNAQGLEITPVTKEDCDQKRFEETVSLEKIGECLVIHFSCQCGIPYQFLLAGGNCYYKLM